MKKVIVVTAAIFFALVSIAQDITTENPVQVKYVGYIENQPLLLVEVDNPTKDFMVIKVKDQNNNEFFYEFSKMAKWSKKLLIEQPVINNGVLYVEVYTKANHATKIFKISTNKVARQEILIEKITAKN